MANKRLFGTDGVRGEANASLSPRLAMDMGSAAGRWVHDNLHPFGATNTQTGN